MTLRRKNANVVEVEQPTVDPLEVAIERARQAVAEAEAAESERLRLLVSAELGEENLDTYSADVSRLSSELADRKALLSGLIERQAANVRTARQERAERARQEADDASREAEALGQEIARVNMEYLARANDLKSRRDAAIGRAHARRSYAQAVEAGRF